MATTTSQRKWRDRNRFVKSQLNVMARKHVHADLAAIAAQFDLRGKGEAVSFATFVVRALAQRAEYSADAQRLLDDAASAFHRDRDLNGT